MWGLVSGKGCSGQGVGPGQRARGGRTAQGQLCGLASSRRVPEPGRGADKGRPGQRRSWGGWGGGCVYVVGEAQKVRKNQSEGRRVVFCLNV